MRSELIQVYGRTAALLDAPHTFPSDFRDLTRAYQRVGKKGKCFGFAERAGLEGALIGRGVPRNVKGVALAVAEAVNDSAADASLFL